MESYEKGMNEVTIEMLDVFFKQINEDKSKGWKALFSHRYLLLGFSAEFGRI